MNKQGVFNQTNLLEILGSVAGAGISHQVLFNCHNKTFVFLFRDSSAISLFLSSETVSIDDLLVGLKVITKEEQKELQKYKKESGIEMHNLIVQAEVIDSKRLTEIYTDLTEDTLAFLFTVSEGQYIVEEGTADDSLVGGSLPFSKLGELEVKVNKCVSALQSLGGYSQTYYLNNSDESNLKKVSENPQIGHLISLSKNGVSVIDACQKSLVGFCDTLEVLAYLLDQKIIQKEKSSTAVSAPKAVEAVKEKPEPKKETASEISVDTPLPAVGNFSGSLEVLSLVEVIQTLFSAKRTGVLMLDVNKGPGVIHLYKGEIVHSEYAGITNKEAFYELVKIKLTFFYFN